jgi:hypothetical protein
LRLSPRGVFSLLNFHSFFELALAPEVHQRTT